MAPKANGESPIRVYLLGATDEESTAKQAQQQQLQLFFQTCQWDHLTELIEVHPEVARFPLKMICQGENCVVTALHLAVCTPQCPVSVLEALVTAYPAAISTAEPRGGRYPLHMALLKGAPVTQIDYLLSAWPTATLQADSAGYLPLHVAVQYASDSVIQQVLKACPAAASERTARKRYALHLLIASRCHWDLAPALVVTIDTVKAVINAHSMALKEPDLQGRLPLHLAAGNPYPRWDILRLLCDEYPEALLMPDDDNKIPLQLLKRFVACAHPAPDAGTFQTTVDQSGTAASLIQDNDVVTAFLQDRTAAEKRKHNVFHKLLSKVVHKKKFTSSNVDLMNCYG